MALIELDHVGKTITGKQLLTNVSFVAEEGSVTTLEGINGSGKTLILKAILGLIKTTGTVTVNGSKVTVSGRYPIRAGVLIETPSVLTEFSAFKNLQLIADLLENVDETAIQQLLTRFELPVDNRTKVRKFSLGMKQKLGIAQAMLGQCDLIVLDEPTNALDENSVQNLISYIKKLQLAGSTFLITSHDRDFIEQVATKRIKVKAGTVDEIV